MTPPAGVLVGAVRHPALLQGRPRHPLGLSDALHQPLHRDVALALLDQHVGPEVLRSDDLVVPEVESGLLVITGVPPLLGLGAGGQLSAAVPGDELCALLVDIVPAVLALEALLEDPHQQLATVVALGGLGVGVQDEGVRDLQAVGEVEIYPGRPSWTTVLAEN